MKRLLPLTCVAAAIALAGTGYLLLAAETDFAVPTVANTDAPRAVAGLAGELRTARRSCVLANVDAVLARIRSACTEQPDDRESWHLLAEAHLERSLLRSHDLGIKIGAPTFPTPPPELVADLEAGLAAAARARELGDATSDLFRIEAGLMSQRITGLATALQWNGKIQDALRRAGEIANDNPHLHVALGLRKLLTPKLLGHDPEHALTHFEFAAKVLVDDERPAVFAAMASWLAKKRLIAIAWLEQAVARNPENRFARAALARLRAGEDDPFGRDLTDAEAGRR